MIVLDTNVVSEAIKPEPDTSVQSWLNSQVADILYLSSVTQAEMLFGIAAKPEGVRKQRLSVAVENALALFGDRILPFDAVAARCYAELAARARLHGQTLPMADGYIAAIAEAHDFSVATRDTEPFEAAGVSVTNPWHGA